MPPTSTPPTIEESLAKLADNIDKLALVVKRLAASTTNLASITSQTTFTTNESNTRLETTLQKLICQPSITKKESNDSTSNTNTDIIETTTEVITETSSLATNINKPNNTMDNLITNSASFIAKIKTEVVMHVEFRLMGTECTLATVLAPRTGGYGGDASGGSNRPMVLPERLRLTYIPKEDTEPAEDTNSSIDDDKDYIILLQLTVKKVAPKGKVDQDTNSLKGARDVGCMTSIEMLCVLYPPRKDL
ncbi:hypothetical protein Tco_0564389 [Tanacetum coccineum]